MEKDLENQNKKAQILLEICSLLMISGANTSRILLLLKRFSELLNTEAQIFINHKVYIITVTEKQNQITRVKRLPEHKIDFSVLSALSRASLTAKNEQWKIAQIENEITRIKNLPQFPRIITLLAVSLSGAGFCNIFEGNWINMLITFFATFGGLFIKQEIYKRGFNAHICAFIGAFVAALLSTISLWINPENPQIAIATSVLFLIPGVPLINSFTDLTDGYIITGTTRFINGLLFVLAIALALFLIMYLFNIQKI